MMPFTAAPAERATNARNRLARTCAIAARAAGDGCGGAAATSPWPRKETTCSATTCQGTRATGAGGRPRAERRQGDVELRAEEVRRVAPTRADEADGRPRRGRGRGRRRVARRVVGRVGRGRLLLVLLLLLRVRVRVRARVLAVVVAVVVAGGADEVRELHGQEVVEFELVEALERAQARHAQQGLGQAPGRPRLEVVLEGPHEAAVGLEEAPEAARVAVARAGAHVDAVELHRQVQVHVEGRGADDLHVPQRRHGPAAQRRERRARPRGQRRVELDADVDAALAQQRRGQRREVAAARPEVQEAQLPAPARDLVEAQRLEGRRVDRRRREVHHAAARGLRRAERRVVEGAVVVAGGRERGAVDLCGNQPVRRGHPIILRYVMPKR